jgi:hypothetical protein
VKSKGGGAAEKGEVADADFISRGRCGRLCGRNARRRRRSRWKIITDLQGMCASDGWKKSERWWEGKGEDPSRLSFSLFCLLLRLRLSNVFSRKMYISLYVS